MIRKFVVCCAMFTATYLLLSIEVGNRPLFQCIYQLTAPATIAAQEFIGQMFGAGVSATKKVGQKLFQNSLPQSNSVSKGRIPVSKAKSLSAPQEDIPEAERRELDDLIKGFSN